VVQADAVASGGDRLAHQGSEPGRVAGGGQGHHGALLVRASPAQMFGDRAVGVAERCRVAQRPPLVPAGAVGGGNRRGLAFPQAVDHQHGGAVEPGGGEGVKPVRPVVQDRVDLRVREGLGE
jgi:hypothetical protein